MRSDTDDSPLPLMLVGTFQEVELLINLHQFESTASSPALLLGHAVVDIAFVFTGFSLSICNQLNVVNALVLYSVRPTAPLGVQLVSVCGMCSMCRHLPCRRMQSKQGVNVRRQSTTL